MLRVQKRNFYKTFVWILIVDHCWNTLLPRKNFCPSFSFVLDADWKTFSRPLLTFIVLCCEKTVTWVFRQILIVFMNKMRICQKTYIFPQSGDGFGWDFEFCVLWRKSHFLDFFCSVAVIFCEKGLSERELAEWDFLFCFWVRTDLYIKFSVDDSHRSWCRLKE